MSYRLRAGLVCSTPAEKQTKELTGYFISF